MSDELFDFVVRLRPTSARLSRWAPQCLHDHIDIDPGARRVRCETCGVELDPIAVLFNYAQAFFHIEKLQDDIAKWQRVAEQALARAENLRHEEFEISGRVESLKSLEKTLRRDIARLRESTLKSQPDGPLFSGKAPSDGASTAPPAAPPSVGRRGRRSPESAA